MSEDQKWSGLYEVWKEKAKLKHGDRYTYLPYEEAQYRGEKRKMPIICKVHGRFEMRTKDHTNGSGCRKCSAEKQKMSLPTFIERVRKIHGDYYNYDKVIYQRTDKPVTITCPVHGDFEQTPHNHLHGNGCKLCRFDSWRDTKEEFIVKAEKTHGTTYDYSKVNYTNNYTPITITCRIHGDFEQRPSDHIAGRGCWECGKLTLSEKMSKDTAWFIAEAKKVHGDTYDYSRSNYTGYGKPIDIVCKKHGIFKQEAGSHITGATCFKCSREARRLGIEIFIERSNLIHANKYDYSKVKYVNTTTPITIICPKHGEFQQKPGGHLDGDGCPACNESKGERIIRTFLKNNHIEYKWEYSLAGTRYRYDFYLPKLNLLIEYHGVQHYMPVAFFGGEKTFKEVLERDQAKRDLAAVLSIPLLEIKYNVTDIQHQLLFKISRYYKYRVKNKFYRNFIELCNGLGLPLTTRHSAVKQYKVYQK